MPHNLRKIQLEFLHLSKHDSTVPTIASNVAKYWLWVASRRASFHTRSIGASCGLYGGRNNSCRTRRYFFKNGFSKTAWWYRALSRIIIMRLPRVRHFNTFLRKYSNVCALKLSLMERMNLPVFKFTAPKQATDLRVGACFKTGSVISGGIHIRSRVPCCWKWHSSRLHSSMSFFLARRRSFFKSFDLYRVRLSDLRPWLTQTKAQLAEHPLTLPHAKLDIVVFFQMLT